MPPLGSNPSHEKQHDEDDQDDTDDTNATVTESVTIAPEPAAEATEQENDEEDNEDGSQRHDLSPVAAPIRKFSPSHSNCEAMIGIFRMTHYRRHHLEITELLIDLGQSAPTAVMAIKQRP
jgi:hypothetical protein